MDIKVALTTDPANVGVDGIGQVGDLYLENGSPRLTNRSLAEQVAQDLFISLSLFRSEWFLDPDQGMPYFQSILGQKTPLGIVTQIFRRAILSRPGVKSLNSLSVTRVGARGIKPVFSVTLTDGSNITSASFERFVIGG